ncbi:MAG: discoidin domain-containing protein [Odoribacteraceae bacterium]|jgi:hypothetical protein|nr:discoidin domain-containing protein [Odoribacteraceae bacterium]
MKQNTIALAIITALALVACNEPIDANLFQATETIEFEIDRLVVPEEEPVASIPLFLSGRAKEEVTVSIKVEPRKDLLEMPDIIAAEGVHFQLPRKTIRVEKGATRAFFPLEIIDDIIVNNDRVFDVIFETIEGASRSFISQTCRVTIKNNDFWPTISFNTARYQTTEHDSVLVIPLVVGGGVIRSPLQVTLAVENLTAAEGTNFSVDKKNFTFTEEARKDSIVIRLKEEELAADAEFNLALAVNDAARPGKFTSGRVVIRDVIKGVSFLGAQIATFKGYRYIDVPVQFTGVRSPRDISTRVRVKSTVGVTEGADFTLSTTELVSKGDTTLDLRVSFAETVQDAGLIEILLELFDAEGGDIDRAETRIATEGTDPVDRDNWTIYRFSSEETSGEGSINGRAATILDGNASTFWHSKWTGTAAQLPHEIVILFDRIIMPEFITIARRASNSDLRVAEIDVSADGYTWDNIGRVQFPNSGSTPNSLSLYAPYRLVMSYLKIRITESNRSPSASISEVTVNGNTYRVSPL